MFYHSSSNAFKPSSPSILSNVTCIDHCYFSFELVFAYIQFVRHILQRAESMIECLEFYVHEHVNGHTIAASWINQCRRFISIHLHHTWFFITYTQSIIFLISKDCQNKRKASHSFFSFMELQNWIYSLWQIPKLL